MKKQDSNTQLKNLMKMQRPSSVKSIIINVITYIELQETQGIRTTQKMVYAYLKLVYHQNPLMFGTASWTSVAGTFRSMISSVKNSTNSNKSLASYIKVKSVKGENVLRLKRKRKS